MKNNEWLALPTFQENLYPKRISDIAKEVGSTVEQIAEIEKVEPGLMLWEWVRRVDIMDSFRIMEYPYNNKMSILLLISGEQIVVNMPHRKLVNKIHRFLMTEPQYDFDKEGLTTVQVSEVKDEENQEEEDG